jgi:hypothetical protein
VGKGWKADGAFDILRRMLRSPDAAALRDRWIAHGPSAMLDGIAAR